MSRRRRRQAERRGGGSRNRAGRRGPPDPPRPDLPPPHPLAGPLGAEPAAPGWSPAAAEPAAALESEVAPAEPAEREPTEAVDASPREVEEVPGEPVDPASDDAHASPADARAAPHASPAEPPAPGVARRPPAGSPEDPHGHLPVLVAESLTALAVAPGDVVVDCTAGRGGHALRLARAAGPGGTLLLADLDAANLEHAVARAEAAGGARVIPFHGRFDAIPARLGELGLVADAVFADLGFCSNQIDDPLRGFSFSTDGPLDMRLDRSGGESAADLLARIREEELVAMLREWGEEPLARRIARNVVAAREHEPITTTAALADLVVAAYGSRASRSRLHPATRTFMAIRIAVNGELDAVEALLSAIAAEAEALAAAGDPPPPDGPSGPPDRTAAPDQARWLRPGSRVAVISFHSLEDRAVKRTFRDLADRGAAERLTRKPILASHAEVHANPRSRSAKLRAVLVRRVMDRRPDRTAGLQPPFGG